MPHAEHGQPQLEVVDGADGAQLLCIHAGDGPTVLLAHGYLLDHSFFELVFPELVRAGYRVIAFDQRGHGRSRAGHAGYGPDAAAGDLGAILEHFDARDVTLVAHSMGAFLALNFCLLKPAFARQRIKRLVLLGANAGEVGRGSLQNKIQIPMLKSGVLRALWRFPPAGRALVAQLFGKHPNPQHVEHTRQMLLSQDLALSLPLLQAMTDASYYDRLHTIAIEARVLCGELDRTCPPQHSRRLGEALPNAKTRFLPDLGHMLAYEAPELVIEAVRGA